jgi:hypothetical protein
MKRANECADCHELLGRLKWLNGKLIALATAGFETIDREKLLCWVRVHQAALSSLRAHRQSHTGAAE